MNNIFNLKKRDNKLEGKHSLKRLGASLLLTTQLFSTLPALAQDNSEDIPVINMFSTTDNLQGKDDSTVIFEPEYSTIPTSLAIDENVPDEERLEIYNNDMLANGIQSEGARGLLNWFIGPLCNLNIKPESTIEDAAKAICIKNYSGTAGKDKWNKGKRYSKNLLDKLKEECSMIPNCKAIEDKWTKKSASVKRLTPEDNDEVLWVITYFMEYFEENDPTKVADSILMNDFKNSELEKDLFDLKVEQFTKKKSLIYKGQ